MKRMAKFPHERYAKDVAGMPCFAAIEPLKIYLGPESMANAVPRDPEHCAIAEGCRTQLQVPYVSVGRYRIDLAQPHPDGVVKPGFGEGKWAVIRHRASVEARAVIIEADTGQLDYRGAQVNLIPPKPSDRPGRRRSGKVSGNGRRLAGRGQDRLTLMGVRNLNGQRVAS